jgi:hypothetical protein
MSSMEDEWFEATGGRLAGPPEQQGRLRIRTLIDKLKTGSLSEAEGLAYLQRVDSLPDDEE